MRNYSIINKNTKESLKSKHQSDKEGWEVYTKRIQRHPFVKKILKEKYNGICQFCGKPIGSHLVIHHADYDNSCLHPDACIRICSPTEKRPNRTILVPNCEGCSNIEVCIKNLYPVHSVCNMIINKIAEKESMEDLQIQMTDKDLFMTGGPDREL